jgi:hypothetical protein
VHTAVAQPLHLLPPISCSLDRHPASVAGGAHCRIDAVHHDVAVCLARLRLGVADTPDALLLGMRRPKRMTRQTSRWLNAD